MMCFFQKIVIYFFPPKNACQVLLANLVIPQFKKNNLKVKRYIVKLAGHSVKKT